MAYGYRYHFEEVVFAFGDEMFASMPTKQAEDPVTMDPVEVPRDEQGLKHAIMAVLGWAMGIESFVNLVWNGALASTLPTTRVAKQVVRSLSTQEKLRALVEVAGSWPEVGSPEWWGGMNQLISVRNRFAHYKEEVSWQGFSMEPALAYDLAPAILKQYRAACADAIRLLAQAFPALDLETEFLDGTPRTHTVIE